MSRKCSSEKTVRDIRRATRKHYSAEEKIRIVLDGLRGEESIAELCQHEGINTNLNYLTQTKLSPVNPGRFNPDSGGDIMKDWKRQYPRISARN